MNKFIFTLLLVFYFSFAFGQILTIKTSVYFKSNKYDIQKNEKYSLDTLIVFLEDKEIQNIYIQGNTDSDADSLFNIKLSKKRALTVKNYFLEKSYASSLFTSDYFGENIPIAPNNVDNEKRKNRRVDVMVNYKENIITKEIKTHNEKVVEATKDIVISREEVKIVDTCRLDTTIILPQGSRYIINICDYEKYKDSIKIIEYLTPESILNSDLLTVSTRNEQLITGGMFDIQICDSCKLIQPLKFRVPVINNGKSMNEGCSGNIDFRSMSLWTSGRNGAWEGSEKIGIIKSNDSLFYEFTVFRSGKYNLDYKMDKNNLTDVVTKFKATGNIRLLKVRIFYQQSVFQKKANKKNNFVTFKLPRCPSNGCECTLIKAIGLNSNGDTLISSKCMNDYTKRIFFGKCKLKNNSKPIYFLGFIPVRRKGIYRKYIIEPKDWATKNNK